MAFPPTKLRSGTDALEQCIESSNTTKQTQRIFQLKYINVHEKEKQTKEYQLSCNGISVLFVPSGDFQQKEA